MMSSYSDTATCPSDAELRSLLNADRGETETLAVETHVESCPLCTSRLDALAPPPPRLLRSAARAAETPPATPGIPDFGRDYQVRGWIGHGGMGDVYRGWQVRLQREVAIKTLRGRGRLSSEAAERLRGEALRLAKLEHPNIVRVYDVGEAAGVPFFAMELVAGASLAATRGFRKPPAEAARLLVTIAGAVQAAHQIGIIHRDLKPANILLAADGSPKVTDFGLATTPDEMRARGRREVAGTAEYMAPEQLAGDTARIGIPTDIYGLGAILYELLTGRPPQRESTLRPRQFDPQIPRDLEAVCLKCLEHDGDKRYASAAELAADLRRFLNAEPVAARPAGVVRQLAYWAARNRVPIGLVGVMASIASVCLLVYASAVEADRVREQANLEYEGNIRRAESLAQAAEEMYADGRVAEALSQLAAAQDALPADQVALRDFFRQTSAAWQADAPIVVNRLDHAAAIQLAVLSPDGSKVAFVDATNAVGLWDLGTGGCRTLIPCRDVATMSLAFSPDGSQLATGSHDCLIRTWDAETGLEIGRKPNDFRWPKAVAYAGADRLVIGCWRGNESTRLMTLGSNGQIRDTTPPALRTMQVDWVAGGAAGEFVTAETEGGTWLCDASAKSIRDLDRPSGSQVKQAAFSPDGKHLAVARRDGTVERIEPATGRSLGSHRLATTATATDIGSLAVANDGEIAIVAQVGPRTRLFRLHSLGGVRDELPAQPGVQVSCGRDGTFRVIQGGGSKELKVSTLPPLARRVRDFGSPVAIAVMSPSADGRQFATLVHRSFAQPVPAYALFGTASFPLRPPPWEVAVWDSTQLTARTLLRGRHHRVDEFTPDVIALHPTADRLALSSCTSQVRGLCLGTIRPDEPISLTAAVNAADPPKRLLFTGLGDRAVSVGLSSDSPLTNWDMTGERPWIRSTQPRVADSSALVAIPGGNWVAVGEVGGRVRLTDGLREQVLAVDGEVRAAAASADGRLLAIGTSTGRLSVFRLADGEWVVGSNHAVGMGGITVVQFSLEQSLVYVGGGATDARVVRWNHAVGRAIPRPLPLPVPPIAIGRTTVGIQLIVASGQLIEFSGAR